ncbi:mucin-like glycoprotein [Trypanosoma rangeli]|uniref:Mucin-like glycoprotein n=1 Tax=Trypanosoma rangeli TaxID=5698 RepID=A0A422MTL5_TRYRA|nr:mucin-like glycoprotein [Trypanosoma rangeli]RNE96585.1 mucin-like glycoprotein [Trypanosoma rangeli]|eukprot:RNE96585.1 mucin-like glycoprotein [Trypanosoma rangeli]
MTMATVRRRAVWALAVLALLCGSCCLVCGAATAAAEQPSVGCNVKLPVEVACGRVSGNNLKLRVRGGVAWVVCALDDEDRAALRNTSHVLAAWKEAGHAVVGSEAKLCGATGDHNETVCIVAEFIYASHSCATSCEGKAEETVAFTMNLADDEGSDLHKRLREATGAAGAETPNGESRSVSGETGVCPLTTPHEGANGRDGAPAAGTGSAASATATVAGKHASNKTDSSYTTTTFLPTPLLLPLLVAAVACAAGRW